jgi:hypothetical protein
MLNNYKSLTPRLSGDNTPQQNSPESVHQERVLEHNVGFTCYVPENFNIDELINENPPDFSYHKDKFNYIAHLITDIPSKRKGNNNEGDEIWGKDDYPYTPLYAPLLQSKIQNYKKHLTYLMNNNVLESDNWYIKGKKSIGYKFTQQYQTDTKPISLTKEVFIRRVLQYVNVDFNSLNLNLPRMAKNDASYDFITKWFDGNLTIEYKEAMGYLQGLYLKELKTIGHEKAIRKKNHRRIVVEKIHRSDFVFSIDNTAGRMHTVLTQLKGELRKFIRYNGKYLAAADLRNSQLYLSAILFDEGRFIENDILNVIKDYNENFDSESNPYPKPYYVSKNINKYKSLVSSGKLYEKFIDYLIKDGVLDPNEDFDSLRSKAKKGVITAIFSPNSSISYNKYMKTFEIHFPEVYDVFKSIKYGKGKHNTLACTLQRIEADLILDKACRIISDANQDIPLFTLHDAIITTEEHVYFVEMVMKNVLTEAIGISPEIKIEYWAA